MSCCITWTQAQDLQAGMILGSYRNQLSGACSDPSWSGWVLDPSRIRTRYFDHDLQVWRERIDSVNLGCVYHVVN